jgi:hypothetical protein
MTDHVHVFARLAGAIVLAAVGLLAVALIAGASVSSP